MERRALIRSLAVAGVVAPFAAIRELTKAEPPQDLPTMQTGDYLMAEHWNALTERVNELSRAQP